MLPGFAGRLLSEQFLEGEADARSRRDVVRGAADAIPRAALHRWRQSCEWLGPAASVQTLFESAAVPLLRHLGFEAPSVIDRRSDSIAAITRVSGSPIVIVAAPWAERVDRLWRIAVTAAVERHARWALLFNGTHLRLVDATMLFARRFAQFEIDLALDDERATSAFWLVFHAAAFGGNSRSTDSRIRALIEQSDRYSSGVSRSLREGVLAASADVLTALVPIRGAAPLSLADPFEQSLTIVYRLLFLLFAEARSLVPLWHPVYRDSYSVESLRSLAEQPNGAAGLWDALRAIARLAHTGCAAGDLHVTPFNGRLFAPKQTPLAERRGLDDETARRAILSLSTRPAPDRRGRERIAYRDLGVEQLGAVYETLLDYEPRVDPPSSRATGERRRVILSRGSGARKASGSFYTPQPMAEYLVRRTLGPLVHDAAPERILRLRVVDPAMGSGAFLVAACRYLASAYEHALVESGGCRAGDLDAGDRVKIRRTIAERCLYGVDINPMAVQLARLSLWLATLAADRPLTFLDHHLQVGDSLIGAWLANMRRAPSLRRIRQRADDLTLPLFGARDLSDALKETLPVRFKLETLPGDTIERVREKERDLAALNAREALLTRWKRAADLWCAPWFSSADGDRVQAREQVPAAVVGALTDAILTGRSSLPSAVAEPYLAAADAISQSRRIFHWELEFPEAFFDADGSRLPAAGFDAVIGNPPWDMIRGDHGSAESRGRSRADAAALVRFTRDSGVYDAQSDGHANRYQLFLERSIALTRPGGRIGLVLPSGVIADHGSAGLRRHLFTDCDVDAIVGFDNQQAVFPIHRSVRFLLMTASHGSPTREIACRLGERDPAALDLVDDDAARSSWFPVRITPDLLRRLSGEDSLAIPDVRTAMDLSILERAAAMFPPLGDASGWNARFGRELNVTDDRDQFSTSGRGLPVIEGKQIAPFTVDLRSARFHIAPGAASRLLGSERISHARLAYRDVASATNRLTLIAAILPPDCVSTHTLFCLRTPLPRRDQEFLCGLFNSFVVNYFVRFRVTTHVTTAIVERLPIPPRDHRPRAFREIAALSRCLGRGDDARAFALLQALVASLYELSAAEFEHILSTLPLVSEEVRAAAAACYRDLRR